MLKQVIEKRMHILQNAFTLNERDFNWVVMHIGMAIGAGIVFLPVKASIMGFWVFIIASCFGYPAMYLFQHIYVQTLARAPKCGHFSDAVASYLGANWAKILSVLYLAMLLIWALVYSGAIVHDLSGYLEAYKITEQNLSDNPLFTLATIAGLITIASVGTKTLFRLSGFMALTVLFLLGLMSVLMIGHWNIDNIGTLPPVTSVVTDSIITLPFALTSILFLQSLSPMVVNYRQNETDIETAAKKSSRSMHIAFLILLCVVFFFALSFLMVIDHEQAQAAAEKNLSALAILAFYYPGDWVTIVGIIINLFAVVTSFFGVFLALKEALGGFLISLKPSLHTHKYYQAYILIGLAAFLVIITQSHVPILSFTSLSSPLFAIIGCFMPVLLVHRIPELKKYRGLPCYIVLLTGVLLVISPLLDWFL